MFNQQQVDKIELPITLTAKLMDGRNVMSTFD